MAGQVSSPERSEHQRGVVSPDRCLVAVAAMRVRVTTIKVYLSESMNATSARHVDPHPPATLGTGAREYRIDIPLHRVQTGYTALLRRDAASAARPAIKPSAPRMSAAMPRPLLAPLLELVALGAGAAVDELVPV